MRCYCCNNILSDQEATRKFRESGTYTEMCNTCSGTIAGEVEFITRHDLSNTTNEDDDNDRSVEEAE